MNLPDQAFRLVRRLAEIDPLDYVESPIADAHRCHFCRKGGEHKRTCLWLMARELSNAALSKSIGESQPLLSGELYKLTKRGRKTRV